MVVLLKPDDKIDLKENMRKVARTYLILGLNVSNLVKQQFNLVLKSVAVSPGMLREFLPG